MVHVISGKLKPYIIFLIKKLLRYMSILVPWPLRGLFQIIDATPFKITEL